MQQEAVKISVNLELLKKGKKKFPATVGMNWTKMADFLIRKALEADKQ